MTSGVARFSASVEPDLLREFDEMTSRLGHTRSSAIQMAMRNYLAEQEWTLEPEAEVTGAIVMIYEHDVRGLGETLTHIQHHHLGAISSTTHVHLDESNCLEIIAFKGAVKAIRELTRNLMTTRGVKQVKVEAMKL